MRKYLFSQNNNFYKANLHSHSTVSDGKYSPEELKTIYMKEGYSIIAFTDHEILVGHNDLSDDSFLALNGYEYEIIEEKTEEKQVNKLRRACHLGFIVLEDNNLHQVCWHGSVWGGALNHLDELDYDRDAPLYVPEYSAEGISKIIKEAKNNGFFVICNHPSWSMEDVIDVLGYDGIDALEIYNTNTATKGFEAYCPGIYESVLRRGKRIGAVATDDCHYDPHFFGGWTMISAENLKYRTITRALQEGSYYASTGPDITELYFEDGRIFVKTSKPSVIKANYGSRTAILNNDVNEASFPVQKDDIFVRITVIDEKGRCANTRAYFTDELY